MRARDFIERFEQWEPRFAELKARVESAQAEITSARMLPNPTITYDREEIFPSGASQPENFLRAEVPIDVSGRRGLRVRAAEAGAEAVRTETDRERFILSLDALDVYHDAALARLRVEALVQHRRALARLVDTVSAQASAGDASGYDRGRLEIELATYDDLLAEAETSLAVARRTLGRLFGDAAVPYDAVDPLGIPTPPILSDEIVKSAIESRPDLRAASERLQQAELELSAARRAWIPRLAVSGGWKSSDTGTETADGYTAGIGVTVPLFDHGQAERAAARARHREAEARLRLLSWQAASTIEAAGIELEGRTKRARQFEDHQLVRLDQLIRRAEASYREGEHSVFELLDAHRTSRETRLHALELRREAKRSEVELWRALGRRNGDAQ